MTAILICMVLVVIVALVVISVFSEDEDDRATRPRHVAPESSIDDLLHD